jgi:hypothetical protein
MRYVVVAMFVISSGLAPGNAATLSDKFRLAQTPTPAECFATCNAVNFSCARDCGLSGSCVAKCTAEATSCKSRCTDPK